MELLRPTAAVQPLDVAEQADDQAEGETESRGDSSGVEPTSTRRPRRAKAAHGGKTRARNIRLSDDVHDRLWQLAHQRRTTVSAVADDLLNKTLPRYEVKRQG